MERRTRLIQRLQAPIKYNNPFSFGGGLKNGGLGEQAMNLLKEIFSFDYMGAAEFEFGAIPKSMKAIQVAAIEDKLVSFSFQVKGEDITDRYPQGNQPHQYDDTEVYVVCHRDLKEYAETVIRTILKDEDSLKLKERTDMSDSLKRSSRPTLGWLEINNHFFFSIDKKMWEKFSELFGV